MSTPSTLNPLFGLHDGGCPPNISSVTTDHDDVCELPVREAGSLFIGPVPDDVDHVTGQAFPHTGITTPSGVTEHDGRTRRNRSDRARESRGGCPVCAPRR